MRSLVRSGVVALVCLVWLTPVVIAGDGDAVAIVNGQPISKRKLVDVLMESHGLEILQQLIVLELAKAETQRQSIRVSAVDVDREFQQALERIAPEVDAEGKTLTPAEKQETLELVLEQKGISLPEFMIGMERNTHLRKLVERELRVTDDTLREEYARRYGEKVQVRHVQVDNVSALHEALRLVQEDVDFGEIARRVSQNADTARNGGLLEPFTFQDRELSPVLREAAFSLAPGEVSKPIKVGPWFHILKLERRIPPTEARFEDVRAEVEREMRARVVPQKMNERLAELFRKAEIRVLDSDLREQYEELLKKNTIGTPALP